MSRVPPMASPAPPPPDAEKPRTVCTYTGLNAGMEIRNARDRIQVVITGDLPPGVGAGLRVEGFRKRAANVWDAPHTPMNIAAAQVIGTTFFNSKQEIP